jgi:hypothetical protein
MDDEPVDILQTQLQNALASGKYTIINSKYLDYIIKDRESWISWWKKQENPTPAGIPKIRQTDEWPAHKVLSPPIHHKSTPNGSRDSDEVDHTLSALVAPQPHVPAPPFPRPSPPCDKDPIEQWPDNITPIQSHVSGCCDLSALSTPCPSLSFAPPFAPPPPNFGRFKHPIDEEIDTMINNIETFKRDLEGAPPGTYDFCTPELRDSIDQLFPEFKAQNSLVNTPEEIQKEIDSMLEQLYNPPVHDFETQTPSASSNVNPHPHRDNTTKNQSPRQSSAIHRERKTKKLKRRRKNKGKTTKTKDEHEDGPSMVTSAPTENETTITKVPSPEVIADLVKDIIEEHAKEASERTLQTTRKAVVALQSEIPALRSPKNSRPEESDKLPVATTKNSRPEESNKLRPPKKTSRTEPSSEQPLSPTPPPSVGEDDVKLSPVVYGRD